MTNNPNIKLLQVSVDPTNEDEHEFRVLIDGHFVKYIIIDPGLYEPGDMCFGPTFISILPPLLEGDWNHGHISRDPATGNPHFATALKIDLAGITDLWHPVQVDYLELSVEHELRSNIFEATCDRFNSAVIVKFARFPWDMPYFEAETTAYKWTTTSDQIS